MYSILELRKMTIHQLAPLAKKYGITRLHSMRKSEVVERIFRRMHAGEALSPEEPLKGCRKGAKKRALESLSSELSQVTQETGSESMGVRGGISDSPVSTSHEPSIFNRQFQMVNLAYLPDVTEEDVTGESLDVSVIDPYWLHVTWTIRRRTIERAKVTMGQLWYEAKPVLRISILQGGDAGAGGRYQHDRYVLIHGRVNHWFLPINDPPQSYMVEIGYLARQRFFCLVRGNVVSTPQIRSALRYERTMEVSWMNVCNLRPAQKPEWSPSDHLLSKKWASQNDALFTLEDEDGGGGKPGMEYPLRISTEMVIYGSTSPDSQVTVDEEWVAVQPDGTFMMRVDVPEQGKQLLTVDSTNRRETQKVLVTLERTTKVLKPQKLENSGTLEE